MSTCAIIVLLIVGAALELAGIVLIALDVLDARRTVKNMSRQDWLYAQQKDRSLYEWMAIVSAGNVRRRALGVGVFAVGLIVQTVGNVASV